jgi:hypothetical protein
MLGGRVSVADSSGMARLGSGRVNHVTVKYSGTVTLHSVIPAFAGMTMSTHD